MSVFMYSSDFSSINRDSFFEDLLKTMPPYRREKVNRFYFAKDKKLSILSWALLKYALSSFGVDNFENKIGFGKYGKPFLMDSSHVYFNISHSNSVAFCVVADAEVGCDVEATSFFDWTSVANLYFTESEREYLRNNSDINEFLKLWTLKESFTKLTGEGLYLSLNSFSVQIRKERIDIAYTSKEDLKCHCFYYHSANGYHYACCSKAKIEPDVRIYNVSAPALSCL